MRTVQTHTGSVSYDNDGLAFHDANGDILAAVPYSPALRRFLIRAATDIQKGSGND